MRRILLAALFSGAIALAAGRSSQAVHIDGPEMDRELECLELAPRAAHVPGVDDDAPITVTVDLLLDRGVSQAKAGRIVAVAARAYEPIGITLKAGTVTEVEFEGDDPSDLFTQAMRVVPERPPGVDAVAVLTSVDLGKTRGNSAVAGQADCIGGVRYKDYGYFVAETTNGDDDASFGGLISLLGELDAKTFAHELGHVLGAHHHYANCAEGTDAGDNGLEGGPCTMMINDLGLMSLHISQVEAAAIKGHSGIWARP